MGAAFFYHLTEASLEQTLPMLLEKSRAAGWVVEVRGTDAGAMARLDQALWSGPPESFLPHGLAGGDHDADQPILLTAGQAAANAPDCVMSVHGAEVRAEEVTAAERVCVLFDGHDGDALARARVQWKTLTDAGVSAQYWAQDAGRWEKKAEK
ncbi:DNA polymerase III subunit chi [Thalassorhabdomicrobium marinisediminis]|uniref:DNA polymerase III subunit chi n=1 Tax=Thalassorhabdomicrobium marinisediminis TaxID=2170577 RepID=A0A2T7G158_9RHOB|nr:DNA polymerase III subunit chi [Thalassorhabdomicrobium marinisediminis]PVA08130.1 DNA polymerase III subunit chi [Thalassorhabdomicrobium marinisediminis]